MLKRFPGSTAVAKFSAGAALGALAGAAFVAGNPEALLKSSFESSLKKSAAKPPVVQASRAPIAGSEEFWLSALPTGNIAPVAKAVSVGDRISMTLGGIERKLEISAVTEFEPKATEIDTRSDAMRLVLVTARDTAKPDARPIRFVVEIEAAPATPGTSRETAQAKTL